MAVDAEASGGPARGVLVAQVGDFQWTVRSPTGAQTLWLSSETQVAAGDTVYVVRLPLIRHRTGSWGNVTLSAIEGGDAVAVPAPDLVNRLPQTSCK